MARPTDEKTLKEAAEHVSYEIRMLMFSADHLEGWYASPITVDDDEALIALESFLLHYRNLRTLLCPSTQKYTSDDDVLASDFTAGNGSDVGDASKLEVDQRRLDKMLAHLTYSRGAYIERDEYGWEVGKMAILACDEFLKFLELLSDDRRAWFPSIELLKRWHAEAQSRWSL